MGMTMDPKKPTRRTAARGTGQLPANYKTSCGPGLHGDGGNLYLQVSDGPHGRRRSWVFRFQLKGGRRRDMGLGSLDTVSLKEARETARQYRVLVRDGIDPIADRNAKVAKNLAANVAAMTFQEAAETYIKQHRATWTNPVHAKQWTTTLEAYVYPVLGRMSVADIETPHLMRVLNPIWHDKVDTAKRVRGKIEAVLGAATANGYRNDQNGHARPNPARWRGHLDKLLAKPSKVKTVKHQTALPYAEMPDFMVELRARQGIAALALEFAVLTCVRTADVRNAKWEHVDRAERVWIIPAFSKTAREHRVPLSTAALAVLDKVQAITRGIGGAVAQSEYLFPNDLTGDQLSDNAMMLVIVRMGRKGTITTHGCRASFRTWALEVSPYPWELAEMSLGHTVGTKVERAYARGSAFKKRTAIMQSWCDYLAQPQQPGEVIPLHGRGA